MRSEDRPKEGPNDAGKMASFFCNGGKARPENAALVIQNLVAQVLKEQPALNNHQTMGLLESSSDHGSVRSTNFNDVSSAFCAMLNDERFLATCFIVEAIDECSLNGDEAEAERGMNDLLSLISTTIRLSNKVKWLVSLDSAVAQKRMKAMEHGDWPLHLNLDSYSDALRPAVLEHIGSKVETLLHPTSYVQDDRNSQEFHDNIQKTLEDKFRGNFLWINLACDIIRGRGSPGTPSTSSTNFLWVSRRCIPTPKRPSTVCRWMTTSTATKSWTLWLSHTARYASQSLSTWPICHP